ncbi:hypothetical protein [Candidatus Palauibacter sp.]|uniref:hypothetical protein n=1 Tax=Candidatus Palauibacter sp. TaxID=3101350 RepID=UPI003B51E847
MMSIHDSEGEAGRVREPVQVYLSRTERERLERLRNILDTTKSDVLRKGLEALESQLSDPDRHPALSIIGLFRGTAPRDREPSSDVARAHDEFLADAEIASWSPEATDGPGAASK